MFIIDYNITYQFDFSKNKYDIKITGFDYESIHIIEDIIEETNGIILKTLYQSKYNQHVNYDSKPAGVEGCGFYINHTVRLKDKDTVLYFEYLLDKALNKIHHLENCLELGVIANE